MNKCDPFKPQDRNADKGGTLWERHELALSLPNVARCYNLTQSVQKPKSMVGPTAGAKIRVIPEDKANKIPEQVVKTEHHDLRRMLVQASTLHDCSRFLMSNVTYVGCSACCNGHAACRAQRTRRDDSQPSPSSWRHARWLCGQHCIPGYATEHPGDAGSG